MTKQSVLLVSAELLGILPIIGCLLQNKFQKNWLIWMKFITQKGIKTNKWQQKPLEFDLGVNQSSWKEMLAGIFQMGSSFVVVLNEVLGDRGSGLGHCVTSTDIHYLLRWNKIFCVHLN